MCATGCTQLWGAMGWGRGGLPRIRDGGASEHEGVGSLAFGPAALIAVIHSLPSGGERVQPYRAMQNVTIAAKYTLTRNKCWRANIQGASIRPEHEGSGKRCSTTCETLVYTRSRVRSALDRLPAGQAVFLRFVPRCSGDVPAPAPVRWDVSRRNIGEAAKKEKTPTTATVAGSADSDDPASPDSRPLRSDRPRRRASRA